MVNNHNAGALVRSDESDFEFALQRLVNAGRPRTALQLCHLDIEKVNPNLLTEMLERMLTGEEPDGPVLDSWYIGESIEFLEALGAIDKDPLIRLEFGLIPALGYEGEDMPNHYTKRSCQTQSYSLTCSV